MNADIPPTPVCPTCGSEDVTRADPDTGPAYYICGECVCRFGLDLEDEVI